jgi:hypothetical protein
MAFEGQRDIMRSLDSIPKHSGYSNSCTNDTHFQPKTNLEGLLPDYSTSKRNVSMLTTLCDKIIPTASSYLP